MGEEELVADGHHDDSGDDDGIASLELASEGADLADEAETGRVYAEAANAARELQNLPSNVATPSFLAERAQELADEHAKLEAEVLALLV